MKNIAILPVSPAGLPVARMLARELPGSAIYCSCKDPEIMCRPDAVPLPENTCRENICRENTCRENRDQINTGQENNHQENVDLEDVDREDAGRESGLPENTPCKPREAGREILFTEPHEPEPGYSGKKSCEPEPGYREQTRCKRERTEQKEYSAGTEYRTEHEIEPGAGHETGMLPIASVGRFVRENFARYDAFIFIGALGICVRSIASCIQNKYEDPAVVCVDSTGQFAVPVLSGHIGGANELARHIASVTGGRAVITTQSDNTGLWALDTMAGTWGWKETHNTAGLNEAIFRFVNGRPTALLLEIKDRGTRHLEQTHPPHVDIYYHWEDIPQNKYDLILAVTPRIYASEKPLVLYAPPVLHLGIGCRKKCSPEGIGDYICEELRKNHLNPDSIRSVSTIELKKEEPLLETLQKQFTGADLNIYTAQALEGTDVPNPSGKVFAVTGVYGVAEACARKSAGNGLLLLEKQKGALSEGNDFTFAAALQRDAMRGGHIEIVGAGPGDPELISVKGRQMLEEADLILYAGSLVPRELTFCVKEGAVVRSSASMTLEEQFALMKEFYDKGLLTVRLHTGDPCIYGAIQEQMAFFDRYGMHYHITPGISSFQAAAAELRSQFTIPEKVQTIILTRGEGRTPMPEKEKLRLLARSQSTMCIFLSAGVAEQVQAELLEHYPPDTPVAACYKLTWKDQRIFRGELRNLAAIIKDNHLTLTTMIVVGEAIGNRGGLSRLYSHEFKHLFRP